ncbi:hypothetical protein IZY60_03510 [Lutibacter sp. B2]|nr:hypothetical protein [Lutibacter sp. B2]
MRIFHQKDLVNEKIYNIITATTISELNISSLFSSCTEIGRTDLKKSVENENIKAYFVDYLPNLFDGKVNEKIFKEILQEYIIEI